MSENETLADVVAEIRAYGDRPPPKRAWLDIAERIEAIDSADAWRSLYTPGNAAAMREALMLYRKLFEDGVICTSYANSAAEMDELEELYHKTSAALSAPPRQCDVGTPEEQYQRYEKFCCNHYRIADNGSGNCLKCPFAQPVCKLSWAQTPYEAEKGAGE